MMKTCCGPVPCGCSLSGQLLAACALALMLSACAHETQTPYSQANWYAGGPRPAPPAPIPVEMEDDGRPAQLPPPVSVRRVPDDPREPWSPNYGGPARPPARPLPVQAPAPGAAEPPRRVASAAHED